MQNTRRAVRGVLWMGIAQATAIVTTLAVTPVLIGELGAEHYGIWSLIIAITGYYGLANMGVGRATIKYIAQHDAEGDLDGVHSVVSTAFAYSIVASAVVLLVSVIVAWVLPFVFHLGASMVGTARWVVLLTGAKVALELLGHIFSGGLTARKRFDLTNSVRAGQLIVNAVLAVAIVRQGYGLVGLAMGYVAVNILSLCILCILAVAVEGLPLPSASRIRRATGGRLVQFGLMSLLIQLARRTSTVGGSLILGVMAGPATVAYFSIGESLTQRAVRISKVINSILMPFASQFDATSDSKALRQLVAIPTRLVLTFALLVTGVLLILGKSFLALWIGPDVAGHVYPIVCILSLALLARLPANALQSVLIGMGRMRFLSRVATVEGALLILLGAPRAFCFGALGMATAIAAVQVCFSGVVLFHFGLRKTGFPSKELLSSIVLPAVMAAAPGAALAFTLATVAPAGSLVGILSQIGAVAVLTMACALQWCFRRDMRRRIMAALLPETYARRLRLI